MRCAASRSDRPAITVKRSPTPRNRSVHSSLSCDERIEAELEARTVVMADRLPHHLAHHVIAQVGGEVTDAQPSGLARRRARQRLAVDVLRGRVVGARELQHLFRLDVEEQQQVEELLEAIHELDLVGGAERLAARSPSR